MLWRVCLSFSKFYKRKPPTLVSSSQLSTIRTMGWFSKSEEIVDEAVCKKNDLQVNEKKLVAFGGIKIIVIRESEDKFAAIGNTCSHYGAPLINGVLYKDYIACPWHGACFNIHTGDIEEFPGCDSIPAFETYVKGDDVHVKAPKSKIVKKRVKDVCGRKTNTPIVVIGGGPAGFQCVETLRQEGFDGRIYLVCAEDVSPYDRTKLSKSLSVDVSNLLLRSEEYYKKANIDLILNTTCVGLDTKSNTVELSNGNQLTYSKLFISTGSTPRKYPSLDGVSNVYYLRSHKDANAIANNAQDKNVVLIGSSFIAMEIAAFLNGKCKSVSVISRTRFPFSKSLGDVIGKRIRTLFEEKNINFHVSSNLNFEIKDNQLKKIKLESKELDADICIVGIGSEPNTQFLNGTDVKLNKSFVEVDDRFQSSVSNIWAGGDVALYPNPVYDNKMMNIGHWQTAQAHGRCAALSMMGQEPSFQSVPFFWSMFFGKGLRFAGHVEDAQNSVIKGDLDNLSFVAYYLDNDDQVVGVATMSNDPIASAFAALIREKGKLTREQIEPDNFEWVEKMIN